MKLDRYLIDTNIALDLLLDRKPFEIDAMHIFAMAEANNIELYLSCDAISTISYLITKNKDTQTARQAIALMLDYVKLAPINEAVVFIALTLDFEDIEDSLVAAAADACGAQAIITRNSKDFKTSPIPAVSPKEFLALRAQTSGFRI